MASSHPPPGRPTKLSPELAARIVESVREGLHLSTAADKFGGMRLDGEGSTGPADPQRPWAETSLTVDAFFYHSNEHYPNPTTNPVGANSVSDVSLTAGLGIRGMLGSAELDLGIYHQQHNAGWVTGAGALGQVTAHVAYGELSYVVFPWFVPSLRIESIWLTPQSGASTVNDLHLVPALAFLIRANIKVLVVGSIEFANGFPSGPAGQPFSFAGPYPPAGAAGTGSSGWAPILIGPGSTQTVSSNSQEFESIAIMLAFAM